MPDLNDFYAFKSTTNGNSNGGSMGCFNFTIIVIIAIMFVLYLIGKIFE